jgi:hypothetical protein
MSDLVRRFHQQADSCLVYNSELTAVLLHAAADDMEQGGVVAELMAPHADDPAGSVPSLRFAGSLHRLVLEGRAPELAAHYPSVGGTAPVAELWPAARRACREHLADLRPLVRRTVQTNEVGRSAALYGVLQLVGGAVRLLELGASGGLNLRCDRFAYEVGDTLLGDPASPVRLVQPWQGRLPSYQDVTIVERLGCDPNPVDATTEDGRLTLTSYVWGDQVERLSRLRAAFEVARDVPVSVEAAGALEFLERELRPTPDVTTVVWQSVMWQYVDPEEREAVDALLDSVDFPVVRASMEPEDLGDRWEFVVRVQRLPGGEREAVAECHGHGPPVRWL